METFRFSKWARKASHSSSVDSASTGSAAEASSRSARPANWSRGDFGGQDADTSAARETIFRLGHPKITRGRALPSRRHAALPHPVAPTHANHPEPVISHQN